MLKAFFVWLWLQITMPKRDDDVEFEDEDL